MQKESSHVRPSHDERPVAVGLWGTNGHQVHRFALESPRVRLVALGALDAPVAQRLKDAFPDARECSSFDDFLRVPGLEWVSLCSPFRSEQAAHAIAALQAGIHVYAEKPCATTEADLDRLLEQAGQGSATFHEMAGTVFSQPYWSMRRCVLDGRLGEVVQVLAQKSYPYHERRPLDSRIDGGLLAQNGVHAMRFIEHLSGHQALSIHALDTSLGETRLGSDLKMACTFSGRLRNGGLFTAIANYLNPPGFGAWGNETVRIFGTEGMLEATDGGTRSRLIIGAKDLGELALDEDPPDWLKLVLDHVRGHNHFPFDLETELHPTRMVLRATQTTLENPEFR